MMWLTDLFIDYVPMYAKFRTVASILVIAEFTIPLLAMLALKKVIEEPEKAKKPLAISFAITAGICVLFALMPTVFFDSWVSGAEMRALGGIPQEDLAPLLANLKEIRIATFVSDCWRSFFIILMCTALVVLYRMKKVNALVMTCLITAICLFDMWQVDKRYLNDGMFVSNTLRTAPIEPTETDLLIMQDKSPSYRVLNLSSNTFNENETSYFHKSLGGYHAAKLRRYQEVIEAYISPEIQQAFNAIVEAQGDMSQVNGDSIMPVINMLNAKYFIMPLQGGKTTPLENPYAFGNAWFVNKVTQVKNANEELDALGKIDLRHEAVSSDPLQTSPRGGLKTSPLEGLGEVTLTSYAPNELHYDVTSETGGVIAFSEIYYPGWTCTVDGEPTDVFRVNYVLRAINVKPGKHKVVMEFRPQTIKTTETIAYIALVILALCIVIVVGVKLRHRG